MLEVGRVVKPHGLAGDVIVELITNRTERMTPGTVLGGLEVVTAKPHHHRWIVRFDGVASRAAADALRGRVLTAEPLEDDEALWVHDLVGSEVVDVNGRSHGLVTAVEANPASDLLVLEGGALVPLTFVVEHEPGCVVIDPPDGLL